MICVSSGGLGGTNDSNKTILKVKTDFIVKKSLSILISGKTKYNH